MTLFNQILASLRMMANDMGVGEKFERYVKDKPRHATADNIYYLAYDLDYGKFIMEYDGAITHNTIVIKKATVPSRIPKWRINCRSILKKWDTRT